MDFDFIDNIKYSFPEQNEIFVLPPSLKKTFRLISNYFINNKNNKICIVYPTKEYTAQWLSFPISLKLINRDYIDYSSEIFKAHEKYKIGDKLILNDDAIVEWAGYDSTGIFFLTKPEKFASGAKIKVNFKNIKKLKPAPASRKSLSSFARVKRAYYSEINSPMDKLLGINAEGNNLFIKSKVCLITKHKTFYEAYSNLKLNEYELPDYIHVEKINENGLTDSDTPILISNNLSNLYLYLATQKNISTIIIDGFSPILERSTDFSDIDSLGIPTVVISDLSEIDFFESINNFNFDFYNFSKENLKIESQQNNSPFYIYNAKIKNYISYRIIKQICHNCDIETINRNLHTIKDDDSDNDLNIIRISLIQLSNIISRICYIPTDEQFNVLNEKILNIENLFIKNKLWLGESIKPIEDTINLIKSTIKTFSKEPSNKCALLLELIKNNVYDYIICPSQEEVDSLNNFLLKSKIYNQKVISFSDANDYILNRSQLSGIVIGWAKSKNINRLLSSFLFSELTVLFYKFENKYYNSLQRRNQKNNNNIRSTINKKGIESLEEKGITNGFEEIFSYDESVLINQDKDFDIFDFELKIENTQYSKYAAKGNIIESINAKRIDFESDTFMFSTESHKLLIINELIETSKGEKATFFRKKVDSIKCGDVIAVINTDKDILIELVEKHTNPKDLAEVKKWIDLWKDLLKEHFYSIGYDFKKLVEDLRRYHCKKHEVTIRTWIQDDSRIGPNDDADLISIAHLTNSTLLHDNIATVRDAIRKMTGWRMKASDFITEKIKSQIHEFADYSIVNKRIMIEGLGNIEVLKVNYISNNWESIDIRYVNKLIQKEVN